MNMDPRIGVLNSGQFYAFANGYDQPETRGTLEEVETALGLRATTVSPTRTDGRYEVTLHFQFPAWDEVDGIVYADVLARSKAEAVDRARAMARNDGHAASGRGRYWFRAEPTR